MQGFFRFVALIDPSPPGDHFAFLKRLKFQTSFSQVPILSMVVSK
jgi:hypothetical protein